MQIGCIFADVKDKKFSWRKRAESFKYAFTGIKLLVWREHNARIHTVVAVAVVVAGFYFGLSAMEWIAVALCVGGVLAAEGFNSAIEELADRITGDYDIAIKNAKDLASGAVLLFVMAAVAVGLVIFVPKIIDVFA